MGHWRDSRRAGGQFFHAAREAFGYTYPNYDALALARRVCAAGGWTLTAARFYTGVPDLADNGFWHRFWEAKLRAISWQGVEIYSRPLRYRNKHLRLADGSVHALLVGEEKGIDVRIALDVIRLAHRYSREQSRWIKIASAFPSSPMSRNRRGIDRTDWVQIDRATYDACLDRRDYRARPRGSGDQG